MTSRVRIWSIALAADDTVMARQSLTKPGSRPVKKRVEPPRCAATAKRSRSAAPSASWRQCMALCNGLTTFAPLSRSSTTSSTHRASVPGSVGSRKVSRGM